MTESTAVALTTENFWLGSPEKAMEVAGMLAKSTIVPKEFQNNAGNVYVACQWGAELGLKPMQAMQSIAVINGRPSIWGDASLAMVRSSAVCEYVREHLDGEGDGMVAVCQAKRRGDAEHVQTFSVGDAKKAGLWSKQGPWTQYPKRMLQMRARAFALRDVFPDVLRGMPIAEEVRDIAPERDITPPADMPRHGNAGLAAALAIDAAPTHVDLTTGEVMGPPEVNLARVLARIAQATSEHDLDVAADMARQMESEADKEAARVAYKARARFLEQEPGE